MIQLSDGTELIVRENEILEFHTLVMELVDDFNCSYLEAIEDVRERKNIEANIVKHLLSPILLDNLKQESIRLKLVDAEEEAPASLYD